jgi:hypothetical protein
MQSERLVSDDSPDLKVEELSADDFETLATYNGRTYCALSISISSMLPDDSEADPEKLSALVAMLNDLCISSSHNVIEVSYIVYSGTQESDGIVPTMILCPVETKRLKNLREIAPSLGQVGLLQTMRDVSGMLRAHHSNISYHGNLSAERIFFNDKANCYCFHPIDLINAYIKIKFSPQSDESSHFASMDVFGFANTFRKLFLDFPDVSSIIKCTVSYIMEDCLQTDSSKRPSIERIFHAMEGILIGFTAMQSEIDKLKKRAVTAEEERAVALASLAASSLTPPGTGGGAPLSPTSRVGPSRSTSVIANKPTAAAPPMPINAVHEKRANSGSFTRALQVFKSKLKDVNPACFSIILYLTCI